MDLPNTGFLDFNWQEYAGAQGYYVKIYKNNTFTKQYTVFDASISITGLKEADSVYGYAYPFIDDNIVSSKINLSPQTVTVHNFHNEGKTFIFDKFFLDNEELDCSEVDSVFTCSGYTKSELATLNFSVIEPRYDSSMSIFGLEPFLSNISYQPKSITGEDNCSETLPIQLPHEFCSNAFADLTTINSFNFTCQNDNFPDRSYKAEFIVNDYYGSGITGNIHLISEPIEVSSLIYTNTLIETGVSYSFVPSFSNQCQKIEYSFFSDQQHSNLIATGSSTSVNNFSIPLPIDQSGYLQLLPYDWFGSGIQYNYPSLIQYEEKSPVELLNFLDDVIVYKNTPDFGKVQLISTYTNRNSTGSFYEVSIDTLSGSSFDSNSLFTGSFDSLSTGLVFDYFSHMNGSGISEDVTLSTGDFYFNLNLFKSGTNTLEDSLQELVSIKPPKITNTSIEFNYFLGETNFHFESYPDYTFTGVDLYFSGKSDDDYYIYSGLDFTTGELDTFARIKLVNSSNGSVFDEQLISGSGELPSLNILNANNTPVDGSIFIRISNETNADINDVLIYRKPIFIDKSQTDLGESLTPDLYEVLEFNDYLDYFYITGSEGYTALAGPQYIPRNQIYSIDVNGYTGSYESGQHYTYRFLPRNGYGDGILTDAVDFSFESNGYTNFIDSSLVVTEGEVAVLKDYSVKTTGDQVIYDNKTFSGYIFAEEPTGDSHVATKSYVDNNSMDLIRKTASQLNSGIEIITGSTVYLTNVLYDGLIYIDGQPFNYTPQSFFYPIECSGLQAVNPGQISYFLSDPFDGFIYQPTPSPTPTISPTITPTVTLTPTLTPTVTPTPPY